MKDFALVASLFNQKKALVEPNYNKKVCAYRYLSQLEVDNNTLEVNKNYIWMEKPILSTVEDGVTIVFVTIDSTPIVLQRM
ncbi:hypothetical protein [Bacillus mycoides]|uniref:hypothetical protein n=1 Tax=Bacillus mycoides TaxID=1405 RepID=UPI000BF3ACEE|nr:hypothetical protein [Bacillus mycoides]PGA05609.1 hypothetical protein COL71_25700 [Bacillus mycoides]